MKTNRLLSTVMIGLGFPLTQLAILLYTPAFSILSETFGVTPQAMLFTFTIVLIGYMSGTLFWGTLSDYIGRRTSLLIGTGFYAIVACAIPEVTTYLQFCLAMSVYGFIAATFTSVGNAMLRDIHGKDRVAQVIAIVGITMATTPVIAPVVAAHLITLFGWQAVYYSVAIIAVIMLIGLFRYVPADTKGAQSARSNLFAAFSTHVINREFLGYVICIALVMGALSSTLEMLPLIYTHYLSLPLITYGYLSLLFMAPYPLGAVLSSYLVSKLGTRTVLIVGTVTASMSAIVLAICTSMQSHSIIVLSTLLGLCFLGFGLSLSMAKAGSMSSVNTHVGSASSMMKFLQSFGGVVVTTINAKLHQTDSISHYGVLIAVVLVMSVVVVTVMTQRRSA